MKTISTRALYTTLALLGTLIPVSCGTITQDTSLQIPQPDPSKNLTATASSSETTAESHIDSATEGTAPAVDPEKTTASSALTYSRPIEFSTSEISGRITRAESSTEDLDTAAKEAGLTWGTWFAVELTNHTESEVRPQLINLHNAAGEHFQAYGEIATLYIFAKKVPENQTVQEIKNSSTHSSPLEAGETKTVYFYSVMPIPDGFDSGTIQLLVHGNNLIINLPENSAH